MRMEYILVLRFLVWDRHWLLLPYETPGWPSFQCLPSAFLANFGATQILPLSSLGVFPCRIFLTVCMSLFVSPACFYSKPIILDCGWIFLNLTSFPKTPFPNPVTFYLSVVKVMVRLRDQDSFPNHRYLGPDLNRSHSTSCSLEEGHFINQTPWCEEILFGKELRGHPLKQ